VPRDETSTPLKFRDADREIAEIGARQHGAISTKQLLVAGLSYATISNRLDDGRLHRRHHAVYAIGHPRLSDEGRLWAAVLAAPGALLDAQTAAWALRILDPHPDPLHLVSATRRRSTERLRFRTTSPLPALLNVRGLPISDLNTTLDRLTPALRQRAQANAAFAGLLPRNNDTESPLADALLRLIRRAGLMEPEREQYVLGKRRDFVYRAQRLIVETDGGRAHDNHVAFHADRRRDAEALAQGWRTVRFTREQIEGDPEYVIATLKALLTASSVSG
jgi:very-short-patch-repair endonuclease